ncbi:MAG TPA: trehalose-phosphatase [Alphaproteobacteria bacterium]|nr:trehalose-phosphatase [Alphaproteobacteria bacterium]
MVPAISEGDALFLDFDGTLVEIAPSPESVMVGRELPQLLARAAQRLEGAVAVISGRALDDLLAMLRPFAGAAAGIHGLERRTADGRLIRAATGDLVAEAREMLAAFAAATPGVRLEDKGAALALHFRARPDAAFACLKIAHDAAKRAQSRLVVIQGKMVVELRPREANKGSAILAFLSEPPFLGRRPIFIGDDRTDEDGFAVVNRVGGIAIHVGTPGTTAAPFQLPDVAAVITWIAEFAPPPRLPEPQLPLSS